MFAVPAADASAEEVVTAPPPPYIGTPAMNRIDVPVYVVDTMV